MVTIQMHKSVAEDFSKIAKKRGLEISEYWQTLAHEELLFNDLEESRKSGTIELNKPEDLLTY